MYFIYIFPSITISQLTSLCNLGMQSKCSNVWAVLNNMLLSSCSYIYKGDPVSHFLNCEVWSNYRQLSVGPINAWCSTHAEPTSGSRIEAHNCSCNSVFMYTSTLSAFDWLVTQCFTHVRMYGGVREGNLAVLWNGVVCSRYISLSPMLVSLSSAMGFWLCWGCVKMGEDLGSMRRGSCRRFGWGEVYEEGEGDDGEDVWEKKRKCETECGEGQVDRECNSHIASFCQNDR